MEILKWYSIILIGIGVISNLWLYIQTRTTNKFLAVFLLIPTLMYLILK